MSQTGTTTSQNQQQQIELTDIFAPIIEPIKNPLFVGCFGLLIFLLVLSALTGKSKVHEARLVNRSELNRAQKIGLRQIAEQIPKRPALQLDTLVLPSLAPAVAVIGSSGIGKTRTYFDPAIKSALDQGWPIMVLDVKGNLKKKHAAYAHSLGYDVYVYAPGSEYSDGINFLDFMGSEEDAKAATELAEVLNINLKERGTSKGDDFFSPQGISLLKLVFMLAKSSSFPDLFMAWKFLSLDKLAHRLLAAKKYGLFDSDREDETIRGINTWIGEAAEPLISVGDVDETAKGIIGSATTYFQKLVDKSLMPCLLKSTIPLDLTGKQIVFFQIDENALKVTGPLVAAAMHMFFYRNLNGKVKREKTLGVFLDEIGTVRFPDLDNLISRAREYGGLFSVGYQSNAQIEKQYTELELRTLLSNSTTKFIFRTGDPDSAKKFSSGFGHTDKRHKTESRTQGKNSSRTLTEHVEKVALLSEDKFNEGMGQGEAAITNLEFKGHPHHGKVKIQKKNDDLWDRSEEAWDEVICPTLIEQAEQIYKDTTMEVEKKDRAVIAEAILPSPGQLKAYQEVKTLRERIAVLG